MAVAEPSAERVRGELWTSFASLLRSYVAAHGLQHLGEDGAHVEISGDKILVRRGSRVVELKLEAVSGAGRWSLHGVAKGGFRLQEDGAMQFDAEGVEEMDMAAERIARLVYAVS